MRTTALLKNGSAQGSGRFRTDRHGFAAGTWIGKANNVASTLTLDTTLSNADSFTIEGPGDFTANGEFTISL